MLAKITIVMRLQVHVFFFLHVRELIYLYQWHKTEVYRSSVGKEAHEFLI